MTRSNRLRLFILIVGIHLFVLPLRAQEVQSLYFMRLPQANLMNPASQPYCNFYLDFPIVGSTNISVLNSSLSFDDLVFPGTGKYADSLITLLHPSYNIDDFLSKLQAKNFISSSVNTNILAFGFRSKNLYFHINFAENANIFLGYPKDMMTWLFKGNESFMGGKADFSSLEMEATLYGSYALGVTANITHDLTIGVRGKFLSGIVNMSLKNKGMGIAINNDDYSHTLDADLTMNVSAPLEVQTDSAGNVDDVQLKQDFDKPSNLIHYLVNPDNPGFAFDLGANYRLSDRFSLSASVLDLGMIRWKRDVNNFSSKGSFVFKGLDASPAFNVYDTTTLDDIANNLLDTLQTVFEPTYSQDPYTTTLNPKIYLGGTFNLTENFYLGLLSKTEIHKENIIQSFTVSANASLARFLDATLSYSYSNHTYNNIGAGLSLRGGPFQVYVLTDYALGVLYPDNTHALGVWFGLNLSFGCKKKSLSDTPLIW